jgi:hypothetical protein
VQTLPDTSVAIETQLRYFTNFTFTYDTLMWLVGTFYLIDILAISFRQFSCDDVCPSWNVQAKGRTKKHTVWPIWNLCVGKPQPRQSCVKSCSFVACSSDDALRLPLPAPAERT